MNGQSTMYAINAFPGLRTKRESKRESTAHAHFSRRGMETASAKLGKHKRFAKGALPKEQFVKRGKPACALAHLFVFAKGVPLKEPFAA